MKNKIEGIVTTYWDDCDNLVLCNPSPHIDWEHMENIGDNQAIYALLENQLWEHDYEIIQPEDIGALTSAPIIGYDVMRDEDGNFAGAKKIWWLENYALILVWEELKDGREVVFQLVKEED